MAEKAKFDREAAFKSIIGAGRQSENAVIIWIGILIKRCVGWRWRKERI